ncbi:fbe76cc2-3712-421b-a4fd-21646821edd9 [Thermothielavioides terrestris]
MPYNI